MRVKSKPPDHCRGCKAHWSKGIADGKHNNWCCFYGKPAPTAFNTCIQQGTKDKQT